MVQDRPMHQPNLRAPYVPGCFLTVLLIMLAVAFWSRIVALAWYWQAGLAVCALVLLVRAFASGRSLELWQVSLPNALVNADRYEEALKALDELLKRYPGNSEAHYLRGQCLDHFGRTAEADAAWELALKHNPRHMKAANNLACNHMGRGDYLTAATYFTVAVENGLLISGDLECRKNVDRIKHALTESGVAAERAGDFQRAFQYADARVKIDPGFAVAYAWRGQQHLGLGNCRAAIEDAKTCLRLDPNYENAKRLLRKAEGELNRELAGRQLAARRQEPQPRRGLTSASAATLVKSSFHSSAAPLSSQTAERSRELESSTLLLWQIGDKAFDRFEIRKTFHGGMATIYCAWDLKSNAPVAIKAIEPRKSAGGGIEKATFRQELENWFRLGKHPRIVELLSVEKVDFRHLVVVMEYIVGEPGPTLCDHLREKKRLPVREAARIAVGICEAMQFAYDQRRLVHRDLKPQNVFITASGQVKVGDFGLAEAEGTPVGEFAGTLQYAAPEQWDPGARITSAMDVYAIGVILFEMVCGRLPFELPPEYRNAHDAVRLAQFGKMHREQPPPIPSSLSPGLDPRLVAIILQCLAKDGTRRPATAVALRRALLPLAGMHDHPVAQDATGSWEGSPAARAYNAGVTADSLGHYPEALAQYQEAVRHEPLKSQRSDAWCNMGKVLGQMYRHEEALSAYRQAVSINPDDLHAMHGAAVCLDVLRSYDEALEVIEQALRKAPKRADSHVCKGSILLDLRRVDLAVEAYARALELKPDHQYALNGLGLCSETQGDYEQALELFDRAIQMHEEFAEAYNNRSRILTLLRREEDAVEAALRAVQYDPDNAIHQMNLGIAYGNLRRFREALEPLEQAVQLDPNNGKACLSLAEAYGETGQFAKAVEFGLRAAKLGEPRGMEVVRMAQDSTGSSPLPGESTTVVRQKRTSSDDRPKHRETMQVARAQPTPVKALKSVQESPKAQMIRNSGEVIEQTESASTKPSTNVRCSCGVENPPDNKFCNQCGKPSQPAAETKCPHCNKAVPAGVKFCVHCGKKVPT